MLCPKPPRVVAFFCKPVENRQAWQQVLTLSIDSRSVPVASVRLTPAMHKHSSLAGDLPTI